MRFAPLGCQVCEGAYLALQGLQLEVVQPPRPPMGDSVEVEAVGIGVAEACGLTMQVSCTVASQGGSCGGGAGLQDSSTRCKHQLPPWCELPDLNE